MLSPKFSLTERFILNPILYLRADTLTNSDCSLLFRAKVWHFIEAEIQARVIAIFTSVVALGDVAFHISAGCYKAVNHFVNAPSFSFHEVYEHFQAAAFFAQIGLVGSVAATVWPGVCKYFIKQPVFPLSCSERVRDFAHCLTLRGSTNKKELENFWNESSLLDKHWFVRVFNHDLPLYENIRRSFADKVYKPINEGQPANWYNDQEVASKVNDLWRSNPCDKAFFFHATSEKALESILRTKKVEVRHEKLYRGAFVSTQPEFTFGPCVLAFNRVIERLSPLEHGFAVDGAYWAGFSKDIPVTFDALSYILIKGNNEERNSLQLKCNTWFGRYIQVVRWSDAQASLSKINDLYMGIPKEWRKDSHEQGVAILQAMKIVAKKEEALCKSVLAQWSPLSIFSFIQRIFISLFAQKQRQYHQRMVMA